MTWKEMQTLPEGQLSSESPAAPGSIPERGPGHLCLDISSADISRLLTSAILDPQKAEL